MKITRCLAVLAGSTLLATSVLAQSQAACDCIAASPRVRQMMEDQRAVPPTMAPAVGGADYISGDQYVTGERMQGQLVVAPPRAREQIADQEDQTTAAIVLDNEPDTVGYHATCHGITASPRAHQMLKDQRPTVEIYEVR
jgi:hypothetical protein